VVETAAEFFARYRGKADGKGLMPYLENVPSVEPEEFDRID
jgi:hypothetical protein